MEHDPVEQAFPPAAQVVHQLGLLAVGQLQVFPVLARLVQQRVVVGIVVAEDEPALPVGDVPGRDVHVLLA